MKREIDELRKRIENLEKEVAELKQGEEKPKEKFKSKAPFYYQKYSYYKKGKKE